MNNNNEEKTMAITSAYGVTIKLARTSAGIYQVLTTIKGKTECRNYPDYHSALRMFNDFEAALRKINSCRSLPLYI